MARRSPLSRFLQDQHGSFSTFAMFGALGTLIVGALAVDTGNAFLVRNRLQLAADAASLAAAKDLPDTDAARASALYYVDKNLPDAQYASVAALSDIEFGSWDPFARTFDTSAENPDTVSVILDKRAGKGGVIAPMLLGIIGFDGFQTGARSLASKGRTSLNCSIFAFSTGTSIINSATSITGDVCYARGVTSTTNQKAESFAGATIVHEQVSAFAFTDKDFLPTLGIKTSDYDELLDEEESRLNSMANGLGSLATNTVLASPLVLAGSTITVTGTTGGNTVVSLSGLEMNSATIQLSGDSTYVFNFATTDGTRGTFNFADSNIVLLNGAKPENVYWNFKTPFDVTVNKATNVFRGHIVGPTSSVIYHNPADFDGSISALDINLHSMFDLYGIPPMFGSSGTTPSRLVN